MAGYSYGEIALARLTGKKPKCIDGLVIGSLYFYHPSCLPSFTGFVRFKSRSQSRKRKRGESTESTPKTNR